MSDVPGRSLALVGPGRAGSTVAAALVDAGWRVRAVAGRRVDADSVVAGAARFGAPAVTVEQAGAAVDLVVIAVPDREIAGVASAMAATVATATLVVHLSGATGVDALAALPCRVGALHPLQTMPGGDGRADALAGAGAAVAGDPEVADLARQMGMTPFAVRDDERASYHAAACIASNHLVALLAQVDACTDVPLDAFLPLICASVANVAELGAEAALTGPVARGDVDTVRSHLVAIPEGERPAYVALARRAAVLAGRDPDLGGVLA